MRFVRPAVATLGCTVLVGCQLLPSEWVGGRAPSGELGAALPGVALAGALVPLYTYPSDPSWGRVVAAKQRYPGVSLLAIVNPDSGVGPKVNADYTAGIRRLREGGVAVLGYVATTYGRRKSHQLDREVSTWRTYYPDVQGIFFDQMANAPGHEKYYRNATRHAKGIGFTTTIGNPGTDIGASYADTVDTLVLHDNAGLPDPARLCGSWYAQVPDKRKFAALSYGVPGLDGESTRRIAGCAGLSYRTDDLLPNPWDTLPGYFESFVAILAGL